MKLRRLSVTVATRCTNPDVTVIGGSWFWFGEGLESSGAADCRGETFRGRARFLGERGYAHSVKENRHYNQETHCFHYRDYRYSLRLASILCTLTPLASLSFRA